MQKEKNEKLTLEDLQVQSFVTSLDSEIEQKVMGGARVTDPSHTTIHTDPILDPDHCGSLIRVK
jgi:hypothetical protein